MAAITVDKTTAGYVPPGFVFGVGSTAQTTTNNLNTDVSNIHSTQGLKLTVFHCTAVANAETITEEIHNAVACAWQPEDATDDDVRVVLTVSASKVNNRARSSATFTFVTGGTRAGWLWVLHGS